MSEKNTIYEEIRKKNAQIKKLNSEILELLKKEEERYIKHLASENDEKTTSQNKKD